MAWVLTGNPSFQPSTSSSHWDCLTLQWRGFLCCVLRLTANWNPTLYTETGFKGHCFSIQCNPESLGFCWQLLSESLPAGRVRGKKGKWDSCTSFNIPGVGDNMLAIENHLIVSKIQLNVSNTLQLENTEYHYRLLWLSLSLPKWNISINVNLLGVLSLEHWWSTMSVSGKSTNH